LWRKYILAIIEKCQVKTESMDGGERLSDRQRSAKPEGTNGVDHEAAWNFRDAAPPKFYRSELDHIAARERCLAGDDGWATFEHMPCGILLHVGVFG
jgi:hypothetical protein